MYVNVKKFSELKTILSILFAHSIYVNQQKTESLITENL